MAENKQLYATVVPEVFNDVTELAESENRSFSNMVETLLMEALTARTNKKIRERKEKIK
jgi:hypothetical protein